jgi:5-methylthioadenosine/S-adenosylhomocysteine deaminase
MSLIVPLAVRRSGRIERDTGVASCCGGDVVLSDCIAYPPLINGHDHLIGNWRPRAGTHRPYPNSHVWVEDMRQSESFLERNRVWFNDGKFDLTAGTAPLIIGLGVYKNLFSGVGTVQDHGPNQKPEYYRNRPIRIIERYRQCHSLTLGNWWGGLTPVGEWQASKGEEPFLIHLGEGTDDVTAGEFRQLVELGLDQPNTTLIHAIALTPEEIRHCARKGVSLCWCPGSNLYLIGRTLNVPACLEAGANVMLGTDSAMSGSINIFDELRAAREAFPNISAVELFAMVSRNAAHALRLSDDSPDDALILEARTDDPFENLLLADTSAVRLFVLAGVPLCGERRLLERFDVDTTGYSFYTDGGVDRFVIGHPDQLLSEIERSLGYPKKFPFLPL